jgi:hypothetical protein
VPSLWSGKPVGGAILRAMRSRDGIACTQCGASVRPGARFCVSCGQPLETPPAALPSETASNPRSPAIQPMELAAAAQAFQLPEITALFLRDDGGSAALDVAGCHVWR